MRIAPFINGLLCSAQPQRSSSNAGSSYDHTPIYLLQFYGHYPEGEENVFNYTLVSNAYQNMSSHLARPRPVERELTC